MLTIKIRGITLSANATHNAPYIDRLAAKSRPQCRVCRPSAGNTANIEER